MPHRMLAALLVTSALALAGCAAPSAGAGDELGGDEPASHPVAGMCAADQPDCDDMIVDDEGDFDSDAARDAAAALLGAAEHDLDADVRVSRRGDEHFMLTEDYVLGRITVELDADTDGVFRVVAATVELPEGPATFRG